MAGFMTKTPKHPRDLSEWAKRMVDIATGAADDRKPTPEERGKDPAAVYTAGSARGLRCRASARDRSSQADVDDCCAPEQSLHARNHGDFPLRVSPAHRLGAALSDIDEIVDSDECAGRPHSAPAAKSVIRRMPSQGQPLLRTMAPRSHGGTYRPVTLH